MAVGGVDVGFGILPGFLRLLWVGIIYILVGCGFLGAGLQFGLCCASGFGFWGLDLPQGVLLRLVCEFVC